jgi:hypothetical protein
MVSHGCIHDIYGIASTYKSSGLNLIVWLALEVMEQNPWGNVEAYNLEYLRIWSHFLIMG